MWNVCLADDSCVMWSLLLQILLGALRVHLHQQLSEIKQFLLKYLNVIETLNYLRGSRPRWLSWMCIRLVIRKSQIQYLSRIRQHSWNIFYSCFLHSADSTGAFVSFRQKNAHKYWLTNQSDWLNRPLTVLTGLFNSNATNLRGMDTLSGEVTLSKFWAFLLKRGLLLKENMLPRGANSLYSCNVKECTHAMNKMIIYSSLKQVKD